MRYLLLLCLAVGCSSSPQRREYRQSAFPVAPAFEPSFDAPHTVGQPGYVGASERLPRGTDRRTLPQTPETRQEDGLWAADRPRPPAPLIRKPGDPIPEIRVLDVPVPHHDDVTDGWESAPTEQCASANHNVLIAGDMALANRALRLIRKDRECLVAMAQADCLRDIQRGVATASARAGVQSPFAPWIAKALEAADSWAKRVCVGQGHRGEIAAILNAMERGNRKGTTWAH